MSHLPPKPEFGYPPRYPPDPRDYARPPAPSAYPPTPDRYATRERHAYPPRSPPRTRAAPPMDSYVPGRPPVDTYRARPPPPPPMDTYVGAFYERREDDRFRERDWDRRDDHRTRPRDEPPRVRERDRRWEEEPRRSYDKERPERTASKERDWSRRRDDERRYEVEPERKWIPRPSKSPPKRVGTCFGPHTHLVADFNSPYQGRRTKLAISGEQGAYAILSETSPTFPDTGSCQWFGISI